VGNSSTLDCKTSVDASGVGESLSSPLALMITHFLDAMLGAIFGGMVTIAITVWIERLRSPQVRLALLEPLQFPPRGGPIQRDWRSLRIRLSAFDAQWKKCRDDHRRHLVNEFRDKYTAHLGEPTELPEPTHQELFEFGAETAKAMELLALATRNRKPYRYGP
jgi:hypothetical protein